jgi:hypothetical protein
VPRRVPRLCDATASGAEDGKVWLARADQSGGAELCLCAHHYRRHEFALAASGWRVAHDLRG